MLRIKAKTADQQNPSPNLSGTSLFGFRIFSWWYVWIPVIVAVTLWIGGWSFGNYGSPWGSKPQSVRPKISAPATVTLTLGLQSNLPRV